MGLRDDEGRGKLRKAVWRSKQPLIHRCPNGETSIFEEYRPERGATWGTETSKYLLEKKIRK